MTTHPGTTDHDPLPKAGTAQAMAPSTVSPQSVSLKIGRTSVMLYANCYRKDAGAGRGHSTQEYLASFSVNATQIPPQFDALLRQLTCLQPERYEQLVERLTRRVLEPARQRALERQRQQQTQQTLAVLAFAQRQLQGLQAAADPQVQGAVAEVLSVARGLLKPESGLVPDLSPATSALEAAAQGSVAQPTAAAEQAQHKQPEERLAELLALTNAHLSEMASLMPESAGKFRKGYPFNESTVARVREFWFRASDAVAALGGRGQLRRPKSWEHLREQVLAAKA